MSVLFFKRPPPCCSVAVGVGINEGEGRTGRTSIGTRGATTAIGVSDEDEDEEDDDDDDGWFVLMLLFAMVVVP